MKLISVLFIFGVAQYNVVVSFRCTTCQHNISEFENLNNTIFPLLDVMSPICIWSDLIHTNFASYLVERFIKTNYTVMFLQKDNFTKVFQSFCINNVLIFPSADSFCKKVADVMLTTKHNIIILVKKIVLNMTKLEKCASQFGFSRVVLLLGDKPNIYVLSSSLFPPRIFVLSDWKGVSQEKEKRVEDLRGRLVKVATFNCPPFTVINIESGTVHYDGIEMTMLKELSQKLNFSLSMVKLRGPGQYGFLQPNGTWNGGITLALHDREADIGLCNLWNTLQYSHIMDYGPVLNKVYITFLGPRPYQLEERWQSIFMLFEWEVWLASLASLFVTTISFWIVSNINKTGKKMSWNESFFITFGILTTSTSHTRCTNDSSRYLMASWFVFALLITTALCSSIVTRLTLPLYSPKIDSIEGLIKNNYHWTVDMYSSFSQQHVYFNMEDRWQREFEKRYQNIEKSDLEKQLIKKKLVFLAQRWGNNYLLLEVERVNKTGFVKYLRVIHESTRDISVSMAFSKHSPLHPVCSRILLRFIEVGLWTHWVEIGIRRWGEKYIRDLLVEDNVSSMRNETLSLFNLQPAFYLLFIGIAMATVVFSMELWEQVE